MAFESTAELAFVISTDTGASEEELNRFRAMMSGTLSEMGTEWQAYSETATASAVEPTDAYAALRAEIEALRAELKALTEAEEEAAHAGKHAVSEMQATSGAIRLLEGSGGIRAMERFTATTLGLGPAMAAIFPVVGALAFTEIIVKMGEEVYKLYEQWDPVVQAEQRALDTAKAIRPVIQALAEDIRKLNDDAFANAFGAVAGKFHEADELIQGKINADQRMIQILEQQIAAAKKTVDAGDKVDYSPEGFATVTTGAQVAAKDIENLNAQLTAFKLDLQKYTLESSKLIGEAGHLQQDQNARADKAAEKAKDDFLGLSSVLESLKSKLAGQGTEWDKILNEVSHYYFEIARAEEELEKLEKAGTITAEAAQRETAVLAKLPDVIGQWMAAARKAIDDKAEAARDAALEKSVIAQERADDALLNMHRSLVDRLATYDTQDYARKKAQFNREIDDLVEHASREAALTQAETDLLVAIRKAGLAKIDDDQAKEYAGELTKLNQHLEKMVEANLKGSQRIELDRDRELEKYNEAEEAKAQKTATTEAEIQTIHELYAAARKAIMDKAQTDLQVFQNSQGWQGVFGDKFKQLLKGDEELMRQWATSTHQSLMLVQVTMQGLKQMSQEAFQEMAQGMGANIAHAIEYGTSIETAMRQALASTLESIAGQSIAYAIYALGMGFFDLAIQDYPGAEAAFTAAAIWGTVGAATAVAGKYVAPPQQGAGAAGGAGSSPRTSGPAGAGGSDVSGAIAGGGQQQRGPNVQVIVQGHVIGPSGAAQLCDIINQAVYNNDVSLYASHNRQGTALR